MYRDHTIGVVIPAYNEAGFVGDVIDSIPAFVDRVYVVDDGSTDDTWHEIRTRARREAVATTVGTEGATQADRIVAIQHETNRGVGGAIKTGYLRAREDDMDAVTVFGADGQMDPDRIHRVLDPIVEGRADYVKGNRLLRPGDHEEMPRFRYVGNVLLTYLTRIASGYWQVGDPQNGYTAISGRALEAVAIEEMYEDYGYCNDLLVKLNVAGFRVVDVPMRAIYGEETSHIQFDEYVPKVSWMLLTNFIWRIRRKYFSPLPHPVVTCYALAAVITISSVLASAMSATGGGSVGPLVAGLLVGGALVLLATRLDKRANDHLNERYLKLR